MVCRVLVFLLVFVAAVCGGDERPRIRAVTAFIEIDRNNYGQKIAEAQTFLGAAKAALNHGGFEGAGGRITTQPFPAYTKGMTPDQALALFQHLKDAAAKQKNGFNIGPAMVNDNDDPAPVALLVQAVAKAGLTANLIMADERGIHWKAVRQAAHVIKRLAEDSDKGNGNFNFGAAAMVKPFTPYYPCSFHFGHGRAFAIAMETANVVGRVFAAERDPVKAEEQLAKELSTYMKEAEAIAKQIAAETGWTYEGMDATPAPGDEYSIGSAIEAFVGGPFGSAGTLTASGIITRAVQSTPVKRAGYSGLMLPVMEDKTLARRWAERTFNIDSILAYSAVCAGGVDTVPLPGDVTEEQIGRILGDVAWLAYKWNKPLAARLMPAPGKRIGERTEFTGALMNNTVVQPLSGSGH